MNARRVLYIAVAVAAVTIVIANLTTHGRSATPAAAPTTTGSAAPSPLTWSPTPAPSPVPSVAATSPVAGDDPGDPGADPHQAAHITDGPTDPGEAAETFAANWLNTYGRNADQWRAQFTDLVTPDLRGLLADADPATVPTGMLTGPPRPTVIGDAVVRVDMTVVDSSRRPVGTLTVTVTGTTGRWLASEIDWRPAR